MFYATLIAVFVVGFYYSWNHQDINRGFVKLCNLVGRPPVK